MHTVTKLNLVWHKATVMGHPMSCTHVCLYERDRVQYNVKSIKTERGNGIEREKQQVSRTNSQDSEKASDRKSNHFCQTALYPGDECVTANS